MALDYPLGWRYYKELSLTDPSGVSADYQIRLTVWSGSGTDDPQNGVVYCDCHCTNFPNDIRFGTTYDPNDATQLAQWIESYSAISANIWIKLPSDNSDVIYMFVGNNNASEYSDGNATFPAMFYDMSSDPTSDWTYSVAVYDSTHRSHHWVNPFNNGISYSGARLRYRFKLNSIEARNWASHALNGLTAGSGGTTYPWGTIRDSGAVYITNSYNTDSPQNASDTNPSIQFTTRIDESNSTSTDWSKTISGYSEGNYYISEVAFNSVSAEYKLWTDNYASLKKSYELTTNIPPSVNKHFFAGGTHNAGDASIFEWNNNGYLRWKYQGSHYSSTDSWIEFYFYWMFVAKYANPEPTWSSYSTWNTFSKPKISPPTIRIYYSSLAEPHYIECPCHRWDKSDYTITIVTTLDKDTRNVIYDNITPGAVGTLYVILGRPKYYDQTWRGRNTLRIVPISTSSLYDIMPEKIIYVKNISDTPIGTEGYLSVKIEGYISGSRTV